MKPTWIFAPPRSGSTFLSRILNKTCQLKGKGHCFEEWFNEKRQDREGFFKTPPPFAKILIAQLYADFSRFQSLEKKLPGIKYILLRRKDHIARAVSIVTAIETDF